MIKSIHGITREPFSHHHPTLLVQQKTILDTLGIHASHGGLCVVVGLPGVGKSVIKEHLESLNNERDITVASCARTMHTYLAILKQLADSFQLDVPEKQLERALIKIAYEQIQQRKTLYVLIDEAHLLELTVLRKLRLLVEQFPKKHTLVLFGQPELLHYLSLNVNQDIKSRITYSATLKPLNDDDLAQYISQELDAVRLGINTFNEGAIELIIRNAQGNLRLCRNLCYGSLVEASRAAQKTVTTAHVNAVLVQPHWRSHDELIKQQVA